MKNHRAGKPYTHSPREMEHGAVNSHRKEHLAEARSEDRVGDKYFQAQNPQHRDPGGGPPPDKASRKRNARKNSYRRQRNDTGGQTRGM